MADPVLARPKGDVSTVGLFYSTEEAEGIVKKLQELPEKKSCKYEIAETALISDTTTSIASPSRGPIEIDD
jgi:hypothetical protein